MKVFVAIAALLQVALCGHVSIRMPYLNPAGVTYINTVPQEGPLTYAPGAPLQQAVAPVQYSSPLHYTGHAVPAKVETHHVGYAAAQVPAVAAVPYVKHIPTVSHVPVTRYEAQPALFEKQVDVVKPAVSTRKLEVRRPAIQKQFYDIEERVIIRPAGSAVVELDEPSSKQQKGPAVIQPLAHGPHLAYQLQGAYPVASIHNQAHYAQPAHLFTPSSTPAPAQQTPEDESVVVDNVDFRNAQQNQQQPQYQQQQQQPQYQQQQPQYPQQQPQYQQQQPQYPQQQPQYQQQQPQYPQQQPQYPQQQQEQQQQQQADAQEQIQSNNGPISANGRLAAHDPSPSVIASQRTTPEENKNNQNKLIELLTARGGVTELGVGRDGVSVSNAGDIGQIRARVLSATPAPEYSEPQERVSTRRVVVSRPIETLQEVDVVEPASKIERVSYQQPAFIKTARVEHVPVHGTVPVVGKAYAQTVAHAAVPVYQKTISPAYQYYH